jgi:hypothetical protein
VWESKDRLEQPDRWDLRVRKARKEFRVRKDQLEPMAQLAQPDLPELPAPLGTQDRKD